MEKEIERVINKNSLKVQEMKKLPEESGRMKENYVLYSDSGKYVLHFHQDRLKTERGRDVPQRIRAEAQTFEKIGEDTSLRSPEVVDTNYKDYLLCRFLEGKNTGFLFEEGERVEELSRVLGRSLGKIHSIEYDRFGELGKEGIEEIYKGWKGFLSTVIRFIKERNEDRDLISNSVNRLEEKLPGLNPDREPVLLHGDFHPWNTVLKGEKDLGVLDCEASFAGSKEFDISRCILHWTDKYSVTEDFIRGYEELKELKNDWRDRLWFYKVLHSTMGLIDGLKLESEELVEVNKKELKKLLDH